MLQPAVSEYTAFLICCAFSSWAYSLLVTICGSFIQLAYTLCSTPKRQEYEH